MLKFAVLIFILPVITSCTSDDSLDNSPSETNLAFKTTSSSSDGAGIVSFNGTVDSNYRALQFVAESPGVEIRLVKATIGSVDLLAPSMTEKSDALLRQLGINIFNLPTLNADYPIGNFHLQYELTNDGGKLGVASRGVSLTQVGKLDASLDEGVVRVNLITVGALSGSSAVMGDLEEALQVTREIFKAVSLNLDVQIYSFDGGFSIPDPRALTTFYSDITNSVRKFSVNVVIGGEIDYLKGARSGLGSLAAIPASVLGGAKSVAVLGLTEVGGADGRLDFDGEDATRLFDDERRVAGEVIAQLIAKYLGLRDVVQLSGDSVVGTDRISDTPSCVTKVDCENEKQPRHNLMYPDVVKIAGDDKEVYPRNYLSPGQARLLHLSPLVD